MSEAKYQSGCPCHEKFAALEKMIRELSDKLSATNQGAAIEDAIAEFYFDDADYSFWKDALERIESGDSTLNKYLFELRHELPHPVQTARIALRKIRENAAAGTIELSSDQKRSLCALEHVAVTFWEKRFSRAEVSA